MEACGDEVKGMKDELSFRWICVKSSPFESAAVVEPRLRSIVSENGRKREENRKEAPLDELGSGPRLVDEETGERGAVVSSKGGAACGEKGFWLR